MLEFLYGINEYLYGAWGARAYFNIFAISIIVMFFLYVASFSIESKEWLPTYTKVGRNQKMQSGGEWVSLMHLKIILFIIATILLLIFPFSCYQHPGDKDNTKLIGNETKTFKVSENITVSGDNTLYTCIKDSSKNTAVFSYNAYRGASEAKTEINFREFVTGPTIKKYWWGNETVGTYKIIKYICAL